MSLSVLTLLERIRPGHSKNQAVDWFASGVAAHEKQRYLNAMEAWRQASAQGEIEADYRIAQLYARGEGVVRSVPDAVSWYKRAAEAGHIEAQFQLDERKRREAGPEQVQGSDSPIHRAESIGCEPYSLMTPCR